MNALGVYILVSLFFVIATMFEFAIVLLIKRRRPHKFQTIKKLIRGSNNWSPTTEVFKTKSHEFNLDLDTKEDEIKSNYDSRFKDITEKIDFVALMSFIIGYSLFNIIYIAKYS